MNYKTIEEIYANNSAIREKLKNVLAEADENKANTLPGGEAWTISQIVEHVSMVDESMIRICSKLLGKAEAEGLTSDGSATISQNFLENGAKAVDKKLEAPDFVKPLGMKSIPESLAKLDENDVRLSEMRIRFETIDGTQHKFPHPFFGDLSAQDWLALRGGHEARHIGQIKRLLKRIG
ncbi:MAG: DinB family protein [Blastocatellia bacterium]